MDMVVILSVSILNVLCQHLCVKLDLNSSTNVDLFIRNVNESYGLTLKMLSTITHAKR